MRMVDWLRGIHHVQITVRPPEEAACRRFYGEVLGLEEVPKPAPLLKNGGMYFKWADNEFHFSVEDS
jgi:catechol 2,3-dioxygenase-like lactoylglutathione lyase family enzyme